LASVRLDRVPVLAGLVLTAGLPAASGEMPPGSLVDIGGTGGCIAQAGDPVGHPQHLPAADHCADGRGFQQLHHVALSTDERFVYTVSGVPGHEPGDESAIGVFARDARTGAVRQLPGRAGCVERWNPPRDLGCAVARNLHGLRFVTVSPDDRFLYTTGATGLAIFRRNSTTGGLRQLRGRNGCISSSVGGCRRVVGAESVEDITITAKGRLAYVASTAGYVLTFGRAPATGLLTLLGCLVETGHHHRSAPRGCIFARGLDGARSVTLSPDGRFVYVPSLNESLAIFARNVRTGKLTQLAGKAGCIAATSDEGCAEGRAIDAPHRLTITRDGRFAYLAGKRGGDKGSSLVIFDRDSATGSLTERTGKEGCFTEDGSDGCAKGRAIDGAHQALLDAAERTLYLASDREAGIAIFRRNKSTGALTQLPGKFGCLAPMMWEGCGFSRRTGGFHFLVLSQDGRFAYAAGENAEALVVFRVTSPVPFRRLRAPAIVTSPGGLRRGR
jgi:6-phosphogluconolactonase (cycloisomerase 2 family)